MPQYLLFNKPFRVLTQFTDNEGRSTLADYIDIPEVYSAGRLDFDSEGLLLLTDDGPLIHNMMNPRFKVPKTYLAQVEGIPTEESLMQLQTGIELKDGLTAPCVAHLVGEPSWLWERQPPIRERKNIPTSWLSLTLTEGKNRQVRRMTAGIGYPTLRLVRKNIGSLSVDKLEPGEYIKISIADLKDNGIKINTKKSSPKAASQCSDRNETKRSGRRPPRNQHYRSRNQTNGKTRPGNH